MKELIYIIEYLMGMAITGALIMLVVSYGYVFFYVVKKIIKNKFAKTHTYDLPEGIRVKVKLVDRY